MKVVFNCLDDNVFFVGFKNCNDWFNNKMWLKYWFVFDKLWWIIKINLFICFKCLIFFIISCLL